MQVLVTAVHLTNIANAIRAKNGTTKQYTPAEMAAAILSLTASATGDTGGTTQPIEPPSGRTKAGGFTIKANEEGSLSGYTAGKIMMALPNHRIAAFRVTVFCPTGVTLEMMGVSDFASGRAWKQSNAYATRPVHTDVAGGTNHIMEWEELINITDSKDYLYDDDKSNDKLTYYCCSETRVKAADSTVLTGATLTVEAFV